jgi:hypothetical protein
MAEDVPGERGRGPTEWNGKAGYAGSLAWTRSDFRDFPHRRGEDFGELSAPLRLQSSSSGTTIAIVD